MSSNLGDSHNGGDNKDMEADESTRNKHARPVTDGEDDDEEDTDHFSDAEEAFGPLQDGDSSAEAALAENVRAHEEEDLGLSTTRKSTNNHTGQFRRGQRSCYS